MHGAGSRRTVLETVRYLAWHGQVEEREISACMMVHTLFVGAHEAVSGVSVTRLSASKVDFCDWIR